MKKAWVNLGTAALLVGAVTASLQGCSSSPREPGEGKSAEHLGDLGLSLLLAPGDEVHTVDYSVRNGANATVASGVIPVADPGATVSLLVGGLPVGAGYTVEMTATTNSEPSVDCIGVSLPFEITAGVTSLAHVDLECTGDETRGEVRVDGTWNHCPEITAYTAAPLTVGVGGHLALTSAAADLDNFGGDTDPQNFLWTATIGTFGAGAGTPSATTPSATYNCTVAGTATITLTVTDGDASLPGPCSDSASFTVSCVSVGCGNGTIEAGLENCDDGNTLNGDSCPADCTIELCGDGVVEGNEVCDDGPGPNCPADCTPQICGDGEVEGTEICDDGNSINTDACLNSCGFAHCGDGLTDGAENCDDGNSVNTDACPNDCTVAVCGDFKVEGNEVCDGGPSGSPICSPTCTGGFESFCGDGFVGPGEECDPSPGAPTADCGFGYDKDGTGPLVKTAACTDVTSASCEACESSNCAEHVNSCDSLTGVAFTGPGAGTSNKTLCYEALECVRNEGCVGANGPLDCFCGTAAGATCFATPNGACKDVLLRALLTTDPADAASNFGDTTRPGGWAMQRATCDFESCSGQGCF